MSPLTSANTPGASRDKLPRSHHSQTQDRVLRVAAHLFATRGFHAVSIRDIAAECQVSVSTVLYDGRSKQQLLEKILARSFSGESSWPALLEKLRLDPLPDLESFYRTYETVIDLLVQHALDSPDTRPLWLRLQLDQPELFESFAVQYHWPLFHFAFDLLRSARERGLIQFADEQAEQFVASLDWMLNGFFVGGHLNLDGQRIAAGEPSAVAQLRAYLHRYVRVWFAH